MTGKNQSQLPETVPYSQLDLFLMVFKKHNVKKVA